MHFADSKKTNPILAHVAYPNPVVSTSNRMASFQKNRRFRNLKNKVSVIFLCVPEIVPRRYWIKAFRAQASESTDTEVSGLI